MKRFLYQATLFVFMVFLFQIVIWRYVVPQVPEIKLLDTYLEKKYQVIYFGDSIIQYTDVADTDKSSIVQMLEKLHPEYNIGDMSYSAYDLNIYESMMEYIARSKWKPKIVVIPISLRSFSPEWDQRPAYQFEKQKFILTTKIPFGAYFYKPLAIFGAINLNPITNEEFLSTPVYYKATQVGTVADFEDAKRFSVITPENIKAKYIYSYMYELNLDHRKIQSLQKILDIGQKEGITLVFYVTPLDYQGGENFVGQDFLTETKRNSDLICSVILERGIPCANFAFSLSSEYFSHPAYPDEHLKQGGREYIAEQIGSIFSQSK